MFVSLNTQCYSYFFELWDVIFTLKRKKWKGMEEGRKEGRKEGGREGGEER